MTKFHIILVFLLWACFGPLKAQNTTSPKHGQEINVLFLGNSYTAVNNLPGTISELLVGSDKVIRYESNTPGGYTFFQHHDNQTSMNLIRKGNWDYVILQEQSQMPSIDYYRYNCMYPAATRLQDSIKKYSPCANVVFYMTWGRQNGGQQCEDYGQGTYCSADFVDFDHMQDSLTSAYYEITGILKEITAPVGEAWRNAVHQTNINLFSGDGSHPSIYGTYLTACVFYATLWNESPVGLPHPETINASDASALQLIASDMVLNNTIPWNLTEATKADFETIPENQHCFFFHNLTTSPYPLTYHWDFGDNTTSEEEHPIHDYTSSGDFTVKLRVQGCHVTDSLSTTITAYLPNNIDENEEYISISPNPCKDKLYITGDNDVYFTIFDEQGHNVFQGKTEERAIDCSSLHEGIFFLKLFTKGDSKTFKFVHKSF